MGLGQKETGKNKQKALLALGGVFWEGGKGGRLRVVVGPRQQA